MSQGRTPHSVRAEVIDRRTYRRPFNDAGTQFESFEQSIARSHVNHHVDLWTGAKGDELDLNQMAEIGEFAALGLERRASVSGRTRWLGGTSYATTRPVCQFNCAFDELSSVYDVVDGAWILLNGSGLGGKGRVGTLHGYPRRLELEVIRSTRGPNDKGSPDNIEATCGSEWRIRIGDSAQAWAKAVGKMFVPPTGKQITKLILDASEIRGKGGRLKGYGWICNGDGPLLAAMSKIHEILNRKVGNLLDEIDIGDVMNLIGTVLSATRKSAELLYMDWHNPRIGEFLRGKVGSWQDNKHRQQSNNSTCFWERPRSSKILADMLFANLTGADVGFINGNAATRRAPWFKGLNPCAEILLGSFCNLVEINLPSFGRDLTALERAVYLTARANYRQTCVDLRDGILQEKWHQSNAALRLCGTSLTGIVQAPWISDYDIRRLRNIAVYGAYSMADELGLPRSKAVTTVKPSGTLSKTFGTPDFEVMEGVHRSLGRHIFNWIAFFANDPLVPTLAQAGYETIVNPMDAGSVLVKFPVEFKGAEFTEVEPGKFINTESAMVQLDRYFRWVNLWADHNVSVTISYDEEEIPEIAAYLWDRWDDFVAVAWMKRNNPNLRPEDIGVPYLPQQVVTAKQFVEYNTKLRSIDWSSMEEKGVFELLEHGECVSGACPIR